MKKFQRRNLGARSESRRYPGGFPTSSFQRFYSALVNQVTAPLLHWGGY